MPRLDTPMRPTTYKQWRALWHSEAKMLGFMTAYRFTGSSISINRELWKQLQRVRRIRLRLDVESEVKDESFIEAMAEIVLSELRNGGGK